MDFLQIDAHKPAAGTVSDDPESIGTLPPGTRAASPTSPESRLLGAPIESCPERVREANPIAYAAGGAPPTLILHGASDTTVPAHQSELIYTLAAPASTYPVPSSTGSATAFSIAAIWTTALAGE